MQYIASLKAYFLVLAGLVLLALTLLVFSYARGMDNYLVSDDWRFVYQASKTISFADIREFFSFQTAWFVRPAQWLLTSLIYSLSGANPGLYHAVSFLVDFCNVAWVWKISTELIKRQESRKSYWMTCGLIVASVFAVNYRHHEAIFWYSAISELLGAFFRFLSIYLIIRALKVSSAGQKILFVGVSAISFSLALLSKESAVVLPLEIVLILAFWIVSDGNKVEQAKFFWIPVPFFALALLWYVAYQQTSSESAAFQITRNGLAVIKAPVFEIVLRFIQYFNGNFWGTNGLSSQKFVLTIELFLLLALALIAVKQKRLLWVMLLAWVFISLLPYAGVASADFDSNKTSVLSIGITGDRYLYYSAASSALWLVESARWLYGGAKRYLPQQILFLSLSLVLTVVILVNGYSLYINEQNWDQAGKIASYIVQKIHYLAPDINPGETLCAQNIPDNHRWAYIFRNDLDKALWTAYSKDDFAVQATVQPINRAGPYPILDATKCSVLFIYTPQADIVRLK